MRRRGRSRIRFLWVVALGAVVACSSSSDEAVESPSTTAPVEDATTTTVADPGVDGDPGVGDPYYPLLGNGGYDVDVYDLDLRWDADEGSLDATATIDAMAEVALDSFHLDLVGLTVESVTVDGAPAPFERDGRELMIDPEPVVAAGDTMEIVVDYSGVPEPVRVGTDVFQVGWHRDDRGAYVASEPAGAATWFPANDHPVDKARFRIEVTVPSDLAVIANGVQRSVTEDGPVTTYVYESDDLMATYLASVAIGEFVFVESTTPGGLPLRSAYPPRLEAAANRDFARTADMVELFEARFGPYPFEVYGHVVVDEALGYALENQTVSLFGTDLVSGRGAIDAIVAHELAHQWFGNEVSPGTWRDIWLNEGFATYAEWLWAEASGGPSIRESAAGVHARSDFGVPPGEPGAEELFQATVYLRGGLALYALSVEIGPDAFAELLPAWVERHGGSTATTDDLRSLAEELSGRDLGEFFDAWVYGESLPPLP